MSEVVTTVMTTILVFTVTEILKTILYKFKHRKKGRKR